MNKNIKAAARALASAIAEAQDVGKLDDLGERALAKGRAAMRIGKDEILEAIGLQTRSPMDWLGHAAIGFGVGALVGATVALFLAPRPGTELREELLERGRRVAQKGRETVEQYTSSTHQTRPQS